MCFCVLCFNFLPNFVPKSSQSGNTIVIYFPQIADILMIFLAKKRCLELYKEPKMAKLQITGYNVSPDTKPHWRIATMFTRDLGSRHILDLKCIELISSKLKAFATRLKNNRNLYMNCYPMLTHICYFAVGMIDELPPPIALDKWLGVCQAPPSINIRAKREFTPIKKVTFTRSKGNGKAAKCNRITPSPPSSSTKKETSEEDEDLERTDMDDEEKRIKEELQNKPVV